MERTVFEGEQDLFSGRFRRCVPVDVSPKLDDWECAGIAARSLFAAAGRLGFLGMAIPREQRGGVLVAR